MFRSATSLSITASTTETIYLSARGQQLASALQMPCPLLDEADFAMLVLGERTSPESLLRVGFVSRDVATSHSGCGVITG